MRKTPSILQQTSQADLLASNRLPRAWLEGSESVAESSARPADGRALVYQLAWLARAVATGRPERHVDISASPTFAAVASAFVPVDYYEFEPLRLNLTHLRTGILDFDPLPFRTASLASVSTAGILETLSIPGANSAAMSELGRVVAPDGSLLVCLPVGRPNPASDAHRVYTFGQVLDAFDEFELEEFLLISDELAGGSPLKNPEPALADRQEHGIGCFWLRKKLESAIP